MKIKTKRPPQALAATYFMSAVFITLFLTMVAQQSLATPFNALPLKVLIDPGHGGSDNGAAHNNLMEKDITLAVSQKLNDLLLADHRFIPSMSRHTDEFIGLDERKILAEKSHVDVFLSIHVNSSPIATAGGTEIYFENQNPSDEESLFLANRENSSKSSLPKTSSTETAENKGSVGAVDKAADKATSNLDAPSDLPNILNDMNRSTHMTMSSVLAQKILERFQSRLETKTRAIRQAPFRVLSVSMAASLVELGFITNRLEAAKLKDPKRQKKMADAIYQGLIAYKEKLDKIGPQP